MALIAEVLGGIGIIISILYLAYEVSQNSKSVELSHHLTLSDQYLALRRSVAENDNLAEIIVRGNSDLSTLEPSERLQFENYLTSSWDIWENAHLMFRSDRLSPSAWESWNRALCLRMSSSGSAAAWANGLHRHFGVAFVDTMNQCLGRSRSQSTVAEE